MGLMHRGGGAAPSSLESYAGPLPAASTRGPDWCARVHPLGCRVSLGVHPSSAPPLSPKLPTRRGGPPRGSMTSPDPRSDPAEDGEHYSVGDIAERTGIAPGTLRMWERRYGVPVPVRLPSGHRRYTAAHLRLVRRVAEAMARGHRPGRLLRAGESELDELLAGPPPEEGTPSAIEPWIALARAYDEQGLERALREAAGPLPTRTFLDERLTPFVRSVGRLWADGNLEIHHEHFATQTVENVLRALRVGERARATGPPRGRILLTTLPGERHGLGLLMAALLCEAHGWSTHLLGTDTPLAEIVASAREHAVDAVGVGVSLAGGGVRTDALLGELRDALPPRVELIVGGAGAHGKRRRLRGITYCEDLADLERHLGSRARPSS